MGRVPVGPQTLYSPHFLVLYFGCLRCTSSSISIPRSTCSPSHPLPPPLPIHARIVFNSNEQYIRIGFNSNEQYIRVLACIKR